MKRLIVVFFFMLFHLHGFSATSSQTATFSIILPVVSGDIKVEDSSLNFVVHLNEKDMGSQSKTSSAIYSINIPAPDTGKITVQLSKNMPKNTNLFLSAKPNSVTSIGKSVILTNVVQDLITNLFNISNEQAALNYQFSVLEDIPDKLFDRVAIFTLTAE